MTMKNDEVFALNRRLGFIALLLPIVQQIVQPLLNEGLREQVRPPEIVMGRELLSLLKATMQSIRAKGDVPSAASTLSLTEAAAIYFASQQLNGIIGETTLKTNVLLAGQIGGVDIPQSMKDGWEAGLTANLAELDVLLAQLPDEN